LYKTLHHKKEKIKMGKNEKLKTPNIELVRNFLNQENQEDAAMYNFRLQNPELKKYDDKNIPILNFKYYKQEYRKNSEFDADSCELTMSIFDADSCELTMSIWCLLLEKADFVKEVKGYDGRTIVYVDNSTGEDVEVETETDTINSLETELNKFIRTVINRRFNTTWAYLYQNGIKIINGELVEDWYSERLRPENDLNRDWWLIDNYEEIFDERFLTAPEVINLSALNEFAKRVHTVGNFMIGPEGFNSRDNKAKSHCADRLDKFMEKVICDDNYEDWKNWFIQASSVLYIDDYFEDVKKDKVKCLRNGDISEWCKLVCTLIENRSNIIIDELGKIPELKIPELK
jgi:hypothetical protein